MTHTNHENTMTVSAVKPLIRFIQERDISLSSALLGTGIDEQDLLSADQRISIRAFDHIVENISALLQLPSIGLEIGARLELQSFNMLGFLISSCQTGRDALVAMRRYYMLLSDSPAPEIFITNKEVRVIYYISEGNNLAMRARSEMIASGIHRLGCKIGGKLYQLQGVGFKHSKPNYHPKLQDLFNSELQYDQQEFWMSFNPQAIDEPLEYANPVLFHALRSQADYALARYTKLDPMSQKVRHILEQWPAHIPTTKEAVAELLNTSSRTLTRRLHEENTQFSHLLRDVRMQKAQKALQSTKVNLQDLAHKLGFADRRGFERAFKQWCSMTPASYHKQWLIDKKQNEQSQPKEN